jgi:hypothetical protein
MRYRSEINALAAAAAMLFLWSQAGLALEPECDRLQAQGTENLVEFLSARSPADRGETACIEFALWSLRSGQSLDAIPVLLKFLTFQRELSDLEKAGVILRPGGDLYPAVNSLMGYGSGSGTPPKRVIQALVEYLAEWRSDTEMTNPASVLTYYFREKPEAGVSFLMEDGHKRRTTQQAIRLERAATVLAGMCGRIAHDACSQALTAR